MAGGACTLRAALQAALVSGIGPHTINLQAAGTYLLDPTLGPLPTIDAVTLTLQNTSSGAIAIDGRNAMRVFSIAQTRAVVTGAVQATQVTIAGVTIQNGNAGNDDGGGILVGNSAPPKGAGGALTLRNVTLSNNRARDGGGARISTNSTLVLSGVTFSGNEATGSGGGLFVEGFDLAVPDTVTGHGVTFSNNQARLDGGGAFMVSTMLTLNDVVFSGNLANTGGTTRMGGASQLASAARRWRRSPTPSSVRIQQAAAGGSSTVAP